mgnify:FL=1
MAVPIYVYAIFILIFAAMTTWVVKRVKSNREKFISENKPAVAGQDIIQGSNQDDGRYDEPNPEDLEQMEKLLEDAAELQGI